VKGFSLAMGNYSESELKNWSGKTVKGMTHTIGPGVIVFLSDKESDDANFISTWRSDIDHL
jgi:hypothetical protein